MIDLNARLHIERLGARGEGIARGAADWFSRPMPCPAKTFSPKSMASAGNSSRSSRHRPTGSPRLCPHFANCGGCAVQTLAEPAYAAWKRGLVVDALRNAGVEAEVAPLVEAWGAGRRRATFHARNDQRGDPHVGFMQARAHRIVEIDACPILAPEMASALPAARESGENAGAA